MKATPDLASIAALIADPSRAAMLSALLGGISLPAGELAALAKISPQTASTHLAKLVEGGLLKMQRYGRHRYFCLSSKEVAKALEALTLIAPPQPVRGLRASLHMDALRRGRTCYDHLAGELGVHVTQAMIGKEYLLHHEDAFEVTADGGVWLSTWGIDLAEVQKKRRAFAPVCLDWSERQPHIAGALGAALAQRFFDMRWIVRTGESRAVRVTEAGREHLRDELGIDLTAPSGAR